MSWWRTNIAQQKLGQFQGTQEGPDGPVAVFSLLNDKNRSVGLTMHDLGDLHEEHQGLMANTITAVFGKTVLLESALLTIGAITLNRMHGVPFDARLEAPPQIEQGISLTNDERSAFSSLMNRLKLNGAKGPA